jgi:hypothetical protein
MLNVSVEDIQRTISQLGEGERRDTEIEIAVRRFAPDPLTLRRLIDWIPEAFGYVLMPHVGEITLPTTFTAKAADGTWKEFALDREPIFGTTLKIAGEMYRDNPRGVFSAVAKRSTMLGAVNDLLNAGRSVKGVKFAGPAFTNIPAEFYDPAAKPKSATSFWKKLVG